MDGLPVIRGGCLCGGIQYEYRGEINEYVICHCNQCKRAQGSVFVTNVSINTDLFRIVLGKSLLKAYESSLKKQRVFCSTCGSPIYSAHADKPSLIRLRAGTVNSGLDHAPDYQQYCESKADWLELNTEIPAYRRANNDSR